MTRLLDGFDWKPSDQTDVRETLRQHGYIGPTERARNAEQEERYAGALRAMLKIQAEEAKQ